MINNYKKRTLKERRNLSKIFQTPEAKNAIETGKIDICDNNICINEEIDCSQEELKEFERKLFNGEIVIK